MKIPVIGFLANLPHDISIIFQHKLCILGIYRAYGSSKVTQYGNLIAEQWRSVENILKITTAEVELHVS